MPNGGRATQNGDGERGKTTISLAGSTQNATTFTPKYRTELHPRPTMPTNLGILMFNPNRPLDFNSC